MKCLKCYWYNPQADGSGCIQGHETPGPGCADFYEDWGLLAEVSPSDPRLEDLPTAAGEWVRARGGDAEYEA